jgi:hypothetical protein
MGQSASMTASVHFVIACVECKRGRIREDLFCREVLGNHHRKSPQGWMELRQHDDDGWEGPPIWVVAAERSDAGRFIVHADEKLSACVELEREALTVTFYLTSIHAGDF